MQQVIDIADDEDGAGDDTFSTIETPSTKDQFDLLARDPPMGTQVESHNAANVKALARITKPKGYVDIDYTFKQVFGKTAYKGKQKEIMEMAISGFDILAVAPTGMGKSLCFQVPAVAEEHGLTIVVTPLLSLMENQVHNLTKLNIRAAMLTSRCDEEEKRRIEKDMMSGHPRNRLLYVTPERLAMTKFQKLLAKVYEQGELSRLVVDEAHCISEWGHDFRKEYQQIGRFRELFDRVPIMALTASATKHVQDDIITSLDMRLDKLYRPVHSFNRLNLFYEVRYMQESYNKKMEDIHSFIISLYRRKAARLAAGTSVNDEEARSVSGIIYCRSKKSCDSVADSLRRKGINAGAFHRGRKDHENDKTFALWRDAADLVQQGKKRIDCIVATVAFGMGIDAPNCRYVIHFDLPTSFEGFYQETGRAGRDGDHSRCLLYYSRQDAEVVRTIIKKTEAGRQKRVNFPSYMQNSASNSLDEFIKFAENVKECRHLGICAYFGEKPAAELKLTYCNKFCDVCKNPTQTAFGKRALDPPDMIATQRPMLAQQADAEWDDDESERRQEQQRAQNIEGLPGFAKASDLSREDSVDGPVATAVANENLDIPEFMESDEDNSMHDMLIDEPRPAPKTTLFRPDDPPSQETPQETWIPRRRPSKNVGMDSLVQPVKATKDSTSFESPASKSLESLQDTLGIQPTPPAPSKTQNPKPEKARRPLSPVRHADTSKKRPPLTVEISDDEEYASSARLTRPDVPQIRQDSSRQPSTSRVQAEHRPSQSLADDLFNRPVTSAPPPKPTNRANIISLVDMKSSIVVTQAAQNKRFKKYEDNDEQGDDILPMTASASMANLKIKLVPEVSAKPIDRSLRKDTIKQLASLLSEIFLSSSGMRAYSEEHELFRRLKLPEDRTSKRQDAVIYTALEIETDIFYSSLTSKGYVQQLQQRTECLKGLKTSHSWLDKFPQSTDPARDRLFQDMARAIKYYKVHARSQGHQADGASDVEDMYRD